MKKALKLSGIFLLFLIIGATAAWYFLPSLMVSAITKGNEGIQLVPKNVKEGINKRMDKIPEALKSLEAEGIYITIEDVIKVIDESDDAEIAKTIDLLEHAELKTPEQVVNIVVENMELGKLEDEKVVALAKGKLKMSTVKKALKMIRENGKPYAVTIPMGKETLKGLLFEKKKEVEEKINSNAQLVN